MMRPAYSLIELIAALIASTVLIVGLASTISISTALLETPTNDDASWRDREIADRLAADLRYAKTIQNSAGYGFQITRPNPRNGSDQTVSYQSYLDGLTRQESGVPTMVLDSDSPSIQFSVDGYTAPTSQVAQQVVRVRSCTTSASDNLVSGIDIDTPSGCRPNDLLLLCIAGKTPTQLGLSVAGWQSVQAVGYDNLRLAIVYRFYDSTYPATTTISSTNSSALSAVMLSIEGVSQSSPVSWSGNDSGYGLPFLASSKPSVVESSSITDDQLNIQVVVADKHPWLNSTMGLASFVDIGQSESASAYASSRHSIAVSVRSGHSPSLTITPRVYFATYASWLQAGIHLEASQ